MLLHIRFNKNIFIQLQNNKIKLNFSISLLRSHTTYQILYSRVAHNYHKFKKKNTPHKNKGKLHRLKKCIFTNQITISTKLQTSYFHDPSYT